MTTANPRGSLRRPNKPSARPVHEILAIRLARLGDVILLLPALGQLRAAFPEARITFLTGQPCASTARLSSAIDEVIAVDRMRMRDGPRFRALTDIVGLVGRVRRRKYELVVDFHSLRETNLLAWLSGARFRIAMERSDRSYLGFCFNLPPVFEDKSAHVRDMFGRVADGAAEAVGRRPALSTAPARSGITLPGELVEAVRERLGVGDSRRPLLTAYVGAPIPARRWPVERFAALAGYVAGRWEADVIFLTGSVPDEADLGARAAAMAGHPGRVRHLGGLDVPEMAVLIASSKVFVSNDTGPMHLGPALDVPTLGLFSVGYPEHFRPTGPASRYLHRPQIDEISLGEVVALVDEMWESGALSRIRGRRSES